MADGEQERLEKLRGRIRNLDAALLSLVAERMELAREVGLAKRAAGIPLRDFAVEKRVLARAEAAAGDLGLAPELARAVMAQLIDEACRVQEEAHYAAFSGDAESVLILGGAGKMGRWFARFLADQGHQVAIHDLAAVAGDFPIERDLARGLARATLVVVAVPLGETGRAIEAVTAAGYRGVLCDIASLKRHLEAPIAAARAAGVAITSIHPMFGPGARTLSDKVVCLCDCGDSEATARVGALFRETAVRLVELSLDQHDRIAAYVLGLSHFVNLVFARVLAESGASLATLGGVGSTTFKAQLGTAASVLHEDPSLYYSIQALNPESPELYRATLRAVGDWARWIETGDEAAFADAMRAADAWLAGTAAPR